MYRYVYMYIYTLYINIPVTFIQVQPLSDEAPWEWN